MHVETNPPFLYQRSLTQSISLARLVGEIQESCPGVDHKCLRPLVTDTNLQFYRDEYVPDRLFGWYPVLRGSAAFVGWPSRQLPERLIDLERIAHSIFPGVGFFSLSVALLATGDQGPFLTLSVGH